MIKEFEIEKFAEFDDHKLVVFLYDPETSLRGFIAIHRGGLKNPSLGATRLWEYESETEALRDALRLSRMMSYKSALAGLKYGGAKAALIASPEALRNRKKFFHAYAQKLNYLGGKFITGTDVGVEDADVALMKEKTSYVIGSRVDPARYTARGVFGGIQAALEHLFGSQKLARRSFAVQGLGKTGLGLIAILSQYTSKIFGADIDPLKVKFAKKRFPRLHVIPSAKIHRQTVDVFVPCALSGSLNSQSISELRCRIVAGSANNQLESEYIGELLHKLGILYVPEYVVNAGGLIAVVDELEHASPNEKRIMRRVMKIKRTLKTIFRRSERHKKATNTVANEMAERIFNNHV